MSRNNHKCVSCSAPYDMPNPKCATCQKREGMRRHRKKQERRRPFPKPKPKQKPKTVCARCGIKLTEYDPKCATCRGRLHLHRKTEQERNNLNDTQLSKDTALAAFIDRRRERVARKVRADGARKARPRFKVYGKKVIAYTDAKTKDAERRVAAAWRHATGGTPETDTSKTYRVGIDFYLATRRRVDLDNLTKTVLDALNRKAWADDTQIYAITARKHISKETEPHTIITIETI